MDHHEELFTIPTPTYGAEDEKIPGRNGRDLYTPPVISNIQSILGNIYIPSVTPLINRGNVITIRDDMRRPIERMVEWDIPIEDID